MPPSRARETLLRATPYRAERTASEQEFKFPRSGVQQDTLRENRIKAFERDGYICRDCRKPLTRFTATVVHVKPIAEGGDESVENLVTACIDCNAKRSKEAAEKSLAEW